MKDRQESAVLKDQLSQITHTMSHRKSESVSKSTPNFNQLGQNNDLILEEQKKVIEEKLELERQRQDQDTQSVLNIRKMFKFGTNDFQVFVKNDKQSLRPYSAYTNDIMDTIQDKFTKIVSSVKSK